MTATVLNSPTSPFLHLVLFPLALIDLLVHVLLFIYTMTFQLSLYLVYTGLFVVCHATGNLHKLEKPEHKKDQIKNVKVGRFVVEEVVSEQNELEGLTKNDSGYLTNVEE